MRVKRSNIFLLSLGIAFLTALASYQVYSLFIQDRTFLHQTKGETTETKPLEVTYDRLHLKNDLFGTVKTTSPLNQSIKKKPPLNITVAGLLFSEESPSIVMLKHSGNTESLSVGDYLNIQEPVSIKSIEPHQVIFDRSGEEYVVNLVRRTPRQKIIQITENSKSFFKIQGQDQIAILRSVLSEIERFPTKTRNYFTLSRNESGVTLSPGRDPRAFTIFPIKLGDTIVSVNNRRLSDLSDQEFFQILSSYQTLEMELLRNQQQHRIQLVFN